MKTTFFKSILFILLFTSFGNLKAQSDLMFANLEYPGAGNSFTVVSTDTKIKIGNVIQNNLINTSTVKIKCAFPVSMKVKIFTMNGDLAKEETQPLESGLNELTLDINDLSAGSYMIQFYTTEGSAIRRMIKMN